MWFVLLAALLVVDGDTIKVDGERYRIIGMDAPETYYARCEAERWLGRLAKQKLQHLLAGGYEIKPVRREDGTIVRDKYKRVLARIFVSGRDVSKIMVQEGYARKSRSRNRNWWCQQW